MYKIIFADYNEFIKEVDKSIQRLKNDTDYYTAVFYGKYDYELIETPVSNAKRHCIDVQTLLMAYMQEHKSLLDIKDLLYNEYVQVKNKEYNLRWNDLEDIIKEILNILQGSDKE